MPTATATRFRTFYGSHPLHLLTVLASGLLLLIFLPGIVEQGSDTYLAATGQTQQPFLGRWLLLTAIICAASALTYAARTGYARRRAGASSAEEARVGAQEAHRAEPHA